MGLPSRLLEDAVHELSRFPGVGRKSALRMALFLLKQDADSARRLGEAIIRLKEASCFCSVCHNISDTEICSICSDKSRDESIICVVEDLRDVVALEQTGHYRGRYHILGGLISPIDGVGPENIHVASLMERLSNEAIKEVILALSATVEGDTTSFYISRLMAGKDVHLTTLSKGIAVGGSLEYADEVTLARSITGRTRIDLNR